MLSTQFEVLTPLTKIHRISRQISASNGFDMEPGRWVKLDGSGRAIAFDTSVKPFKTDVVELSISSAISSSNGLSEYEANDTKVGRITTIATPGTRILIGLGLLKGAPAVGSKVTISETTVTDPNLDVSVAGGFEVAAAGMVVGIITGVGEMVEIRLTEPTWV